MNDQAKFERLLKLMAGLSSNYGQNITQLKSLLGVTERTAYRYLKTIKDAGFIIENKNGCFRIDRKSPLDKFFRNLVHFSAEEAALLSRALHLIDDGSKFKHDLYDKKQPVNFSFLILVAVFLSKIFFFIWSPLVRRNLF